jgi:toxin ParE1/3/4
MNVCKFAPAARRDLFDIYEYIAADDAETAFEFVEDIERTCKLIATQPGMGRNRDDLRTGLRTFAVGRYLIAYQTMAGGVQILRVVHGMRNLPELF